MEFYKSCRGEKNYSHELCGIAHPGKVSLSLDDTAKLYMARTSDFKE